MNSWEFYSRIEMFKNNQKDDELAHYGIAGQKWGKRRWQYEDGRFNPEGKERYFGTKKSSSDSDDKIGGARSNVKDYLKFRNKMLKKHSIADRDKMWIEQHKEEDKQLLKDAKRVDKSAKKMYENQLKEYYDDPDDLVADLNKVYKFGGKNEKQKFGGAWDNPEIQKEAFRQIKEIEKNNKDNKNYIYKVDVDDDGKVKVSIDKEASGNIDSFTENMNDMFGLDLKNPNEGSTSSINWKQLDESNRDSYGKSDEQYWKDKEKAEKYLDEHYDKDFANVIKDDYDTSGEWGDVDAAYEQFKQNPYEYLKKYSRDPKYNLSPKEEKALQKEAKKLEKEFTSKYGNHEFISGEKVKDWLNKDENKEMVDNYIDAYDKNYSKMSKELKEIFKDYKEDEDGYVSKAGLYEALESGDSNLLYLFGTMDWFLGDDGDQGSRNSKSYYLQDKGNTMEDIKSLYNRFDEVQKKAANEANATLQKEPIYNYLNDKARWHVDNDLLWMYNKKDDYTYSKMLDASEGMTRDKKIVNEVNKISKKLAPSCGSKGSNGWWYVSEAIKNLNLESLDYKDLTNSDWDKINAEVNKIKKAKGGKL